jgi:predicted ribosome quality control (RQC) complex YloA/Tae2 family protein
MHRNLSSFDIYTLIIELQTFTGSFIDQIYQRTPDELFIRLNIKNQNEKPMIYIKNEELLTITTQKYTMPRTPTTFAMTLRKYLQNGIITAFSQHEFDRILNISISKYDTTYSLVVELFSNGNIILIDASNTILIPLKTQESAHRTIRPKKLYQPPPPQTNPLTITYEDVHHILTENKKDLVRTLAINLNMGGLYAEELCLRADIEKNTPLYSLSLDTITHLYKKLTEFCQIFTTHHFQPQLITEHEEIIDVLPTPFNHYTTPPYTIRPIETFYQGLAQLIPKTPGLQKKDTTDTLTPKQQRLERQLKQQQQTIHEFQGQITLKKLHGDLIYLHFQPLNELLSLIIQTLQEKERKICLQQIKQNQLVKTFDPTANELIVTLSDMLNNTYDVSLDFRKSAAENANAVYSTSKKFQKKLERAQEELQKTKDKIAKLHKTQEKQPKTKEIPTKHYWFERFHWCRSKNGNLIIAGKDAKSNELIVKKYLKEGDRYVHADIHGAPSCIVKQHTFNNEPQPITKETLYEACIFAASYSKAWNQFAETQAYWTLPEQVSKTPQSGEFVPKGAFIIRGKRNYIRCPLELALGTISLDGINKIMCAPPITYANLTEKYIIIKPGVTSKNTLAKKLAKIMYSTTADIHPLLPSGNSDIVEIHGYNTESETTK